MIRGCSSFYNRKNNYSFENKEGNAVDVKRKDYDRSTIGLRVSTKKKLDRNRAPGQCYDGFLSQLVDMWEEVNAGSNKFKFP